MHETRSGLSFLRIDYFVMVAVLVAPFQATVAPSASATKRTGR